MGIPNPQIANITRSAEDAVSYPILTQETTPGGSGGSSAAPSAGTAASPSRATQELMRQILGWRYRPDDTKGFIAALTKSFNLTEVEGHTEWVRVTQSYMMQADMGEITGAQASLYTRAQAAVNLSTPLLNGLTPLRPDADVPDCEAMRSIVNQELPQLVFELGQPAGPRVQRVDSIFKLLIGAKPDYANPEKVDGHLGEMVDRFGLERKYVNTVQDEQNLTNFLILVDYVNSLFQTWDAQKRFFDRGASAEPYLGTQLVLVSQALDSVAESVQSAYDAMDSVLIGAAERQTVELQFFSEPYLTVAELLGWTEDFSKNEGKQLLAPDTGKDGVVAFRSTINRLNYLVFLAWKVSQVPGASSLVDGFYTFRVQRALQETSQYLGLTQTESDRIRRREVEEKPSRSAKSEPLWLDSSQGTTSWPPSYGQTDTLDGVQITVFGKHIQPGAIMRLISTADPSKGFAGVTNPNSIVPTPGAKGVSMMATFDLSKAPVNQPSTASVYSIVVINPDGQTAWLEDQFSLDTSGPAASGTITAPALQSLSPSTVRLSTLATKGVLVRIKGTHLKSSSRWMISWPTGKSPQKSFTLVGTSATRFSKNFSGGVTVSLVVLSDTQAELTLPAGLPAKFTPRLPTGEYDLKVHWTPASSGLPAGTDTLPGALTLR
jgi:hypothetical protein